MLQAALADRLLLDLFFSTLDGFVATKVDVSWCDVLQALVASLVVLIRDEGPDLAFEVIRHIIVLPATHGCNTAQSAIRLRIWQHCDPIGWDCSLDECAKAIGLGLPAVRAVVCMSPSWLGRFRASGGAVKRAAQWSMRANDTTTSADVGDLFGEAFGTVGGAFEE